MLSRDPSKAGCIVLHAPDRLFQGCHLPARRLLRACLFQIRDLQMGGDTFPLMGASGRVLGMVRAL